MKLYGLVFISLLLTAMASAESKIYHWVDDEGNSHFSDIPPEHQSEEVDLPSINLYTSSYDPDAQQQSPQDQDDRSRQRGGAGRTSSQGQSTSGDANAQQGQDMMPPPGAGER